MLNIFKKKNIICNLTLSCLLLTSTSIYAQSNIKIINSKYNDTQQQTITDETISHKKNIKEEKTVEKKKNLEYKKTQTTKKTSKTNHKNSKEYENGHYVGTVINGIGKDISYNEAISQIIPANWKIVIEEDAHELMQGKTSWKGGKAWTKVLKSCFQNSNMIIIIDVAQKQVTVQSKLSYTAKTHGYSYQILPSDKYLRNAFARWAKDAGYQFVWDVPRDIPNSGMYYASKGNLEEALNEVIEAINTDSDLHIAAVIHETAGQKVLRITKYIKEAAQ